VLNKSELTPEQLEFTYNLGDLKIDIE